jgi:hypothetical protein
MGIDARRNGLKDSIPVEHEPAAFQVPYREKVHHGYLAGRPPSSVHHIEGSADTMVSLRVFPRLSFGGLAA